MTASKDSNDFNARNVGAAHSVLVDLMTVLGPFRESVLLVGGWTPQFISKEPAQPHLHHVGSLDVDIALNPKTLTAAYYTDLEVALISGGYTRHPNREKRPFTWLKDVNGVTVEVDFLTGKYGGEDISPNFKEILDIDAIKMEGGNFAFEAGREEVKISGLLPDGAEDRVTLPVVSAVPFLVLKAYAMERRKKPKDAYDIWYVIRHYPAGLGALITEINQHAQRTHVKNAIATFQDKFATLDSVGPRRAAEFDQRLTDQQREQVQRDAFERIRFILEGFIPGD